MRNKSFDEEKIGREYALIRYREEGGRYIYIYIFVPRSFVDPSTIFTYLLFIIITIR